MNKLKKNHKQEEIKDLENDVKNNGTVEGSLPESNAKDSPELKKLQEELEKKTKEVETLTDTMKRRQADFENYKKRMIKTQDEVKKLAIKDFALDIININDDLLRAFEASCSVDKGKAVDEICNTFTDGFSMISRKVEDTLKKYGIEEINSLNQAFDPNCNEAIEMENNENVECDTITKVHQKGFRLDDYVIRSAKVRVTRPKKPASNDLKQEIKNTNKNIIDENNKAEDDTNFKA